jgi:hypothetical protein
MTASEIYHIYSEIDLAIQEHHLKDALPRLEALKKFAGELYHEVRKEEIEVEEEGLSRSADSTPRTSDEEFVAGENSIDYEDSESESDSDSECSEGCTCEACQVNCSPCY